MKICSLGKQKGWLWKKQRTQGSDKTFSRINKDLSAKLTEICPQRNNSRVSSSWSARKWMNPLWWWVRNIITIIITIGVENNSISLQGQRHCRRRRTPAPCGSTTSMQAATSIHLTGQKSAPKSFWRQYVNNVWKWQEVKSRVEMIIWKISTVENDKLEDVMKMANTRMIKLIAALTSTLTWSWNGLSFVLEPRGTWVLTWFLLSLFWRF